jgi:hypothetical protein
MSFFTGVKFLLGKNQVIIARRESKFLNTTYLQFGVKRLDISPSWEKAKDSSFGWFIKVNVAN